MAFLSVKKGNEIILTISNGGQVVLTYDFILNKLLDNGFEFDIAIQNVPLASSLRMSLFIQQHDLCHSSSAHNDPHDARQCSTQAIAQYASKRRSRRE